MRSLRKLEYECNITRKLSTKTSLIEKLTLNKRLKRFQTLKECGMKLCCYNFDLPTDRPIDRPTDRPTDRTTDRQTGRPTHQPNDKLTDDRLTDIQTDQPTDRPTDRPIDRQAVRPTNRTTDRQSSDIAKLTENCYIACSVCSENRNVPTK